MGKLSPAFKSGSEQLIDNYKLISLLPVCSKTFEKYIQNQFTSFMEGYVNTSLSKHQFGFFKNLGFTPYKAEQPLQRMELQQKDAQKYCSIQEICLKRTYLKYVC